MKNTRILANIIRQQSLKMVHKSKGSHIASALSIADILAVLYGEIMNFDPNDATFSLRDRFILSKGHSCVAVYAVLAEAGFFSKEQIGTYGEDFSWLMNHISHKVPGVEFSTGSLGHGLPFGVGKSLAAMIRGETWKTFVLLGDGEMDEGSNWEALMFAAHYKLSNLVAIIDYNKLQSLKSIELTMGLEPLVDKLKAFGCLVHEIDGHDHSQIIDAFRKEPDSQPMIIVAHTVKGKGVSFMENRVEWHYKSPDDKQLSSALAELGVKYA